jgi:hypothetical protein
MQFVVPTEPAQRRTSATQLAVAIVVAVACFALVAAWLRKELGRPSTSLLGVKLERYETDERGYDVAFLGPSTTYRHVDPAVFDATMAAGGERVRSYNFGAPAMGGLEIRFALDDLLASRPGRLKWVFVELPVLDIEVHEENLLTGRVTWWHDLPTTWFAARMIVDLGDDAATTAGLLCSHLRACSYNFAAVGRLRLAIEGELAGSAADRAAARELAKQRETWELGPAGDGFCSLEDTVRLADEETKAPLVDRHRALSARSDEFQRLARAKARTGSLARRLHATERELFADLVARAKAAGVRIVFITSPDVDNHGDLPVSAARAGLLPIFFDFGNPAEHPELFAFELRYDWNHLGAEGARLYTQRIAESLLARIRDEGSAR